MQIFHGGCLNCITQDKYTILHCMGCRYFDGDWNKPDLSCYHGYAGSINKTEIIKEIARLLTKL